jgi:uncharacterized protein (UPF0335 family)
MEHFVKQDNMELLFGILNSSNDKISKDNTQVVEIFNNTLRNIINLHPNETIIEMNKIFLKKIIETLSLHFNKPTGKYINKEDEKKINQDNFNKKFEEQQRNFSSFNKKRPEEIDFSDKVEKFKKNDLNATIEQRAIELKKITAKYNEKRAKDVINLKISKDTVPIKPILLDGKKVRFDLDKDKNELTSFLSKINRITKEKSNNMRVEKLEEEVKTLNEDVKTLNEDVKTLNEDVKKLKELILDFLSKK